MGYKLRPAHQNENSLATIKVLRDLPTETVQRISKRCQWRQYDPKTMIFQYGHDSTDVFFIVRGRVRVTYYSRCGREVTIAEHGGGELIGELSGIGTQQLSARAFAVTETLVAVMAAGVFQQTVRESSELAHAVLVRLVEIIRGLEERVIEFSTLTVEKRVCSEIIRLARGGSRMANGTMIAPAPTHAEIASRISSHREAVTRAMNELVRRGVLEKRPKALIVRDVKALTSMVHEM